VEEARRKRFLLLLGKPLQKKTVTPICCDHIFEDVISLYTAFESLPQHELIVKFEGEMGVDSGGLTKGMFEAFWQEAYVIVITWARGICLIYMPKPEGHRPVGEDIYIRQIPIAHVISNIFHLGT